jgi:hypothetical protein
MSHSLRITVGALALCVLIPREEIAHERFFYKLASDDYVRKMFATTIQPMKSVQELPRYVIKAARDITGDDFRLANPNERYRATDAGMEGD